MLLEEEPVFIAGLNGELEPNEVGPLPREATPPAPSADPAKFVSTVRGNELELFESFPLSKSGAAAAAARAGELSEEYTALVKVRPYQEKNKVVVVVVVVVVVEGERKKEISRRTLRSRRRTKR